ncbi:DNA cytosine methyltransferase [Halobacteriovorax sp. DPLXC-1]|uniref:DNA cytosine methyltransferase n=1 Tax=Halobacteriovorax sp. DPLXC-1 TaxID=3110771 RepID=UPI003FA5592C
MKRSLDQGTKEANFKFIDLFAGVGGVRLGFEAAGGECVMTSEVDKKAQATYFCNFGEMHDENFEDVTKINEKQIPNFDVLLGGFPCQAFSVAGERKGFEDTRGTLFFDIERILKAKRPKAFLLENVKGLMNHDKGNTFRVILDTLEKKLKYKVFYKVLNTMEYGNIPQTRERIYIVGFDTKSLGKDIDFDFPEKINLTNKISNILETKQKDESLYYERFDLHKQIDKAITKTDTIYQWRRVYVRENKSKACPTLTANMGTGGHNVPLIREKGTGRIRKLSPRECASFQGFPKDFYIPNFMANSHLYKQFGNSVSVPVIHRIAEKIKITISMRKILN